jgi:hypothetical protein
MAADWPVSKKEQAMISKSTRWTILPWVPMAMCAALSLITIVANLWLSVVNHTDVGGWAITFLCFLPLCFYWVGAINSQLQGEIRELRQQVVELQGKST